MSDEPTSRDDQRPEPPGAELPPAVEQFDGSESELEPAGAELELADRLAAMRPVPAPGFRGALGRRLAAEDPGWGPRPANLRPLVALYVEAGIVLIALAALLGTGRL
jgi:hypothetical protein